MALAGPSIVHSPTRPIRLYGVKADVGEVDSAALGAASRGAAGPLPLRFDTYVATPSSNRMAVTGKRPHAGGKPCEALVAAILGSVHCDEEAPRPIATAQEVDYPRRAAGPTDDAANENTAQRVDQC